MSSGDVPLLMQGDDVKPEVVKPKRGGICTEDEYSTAFPLPDPYANNKKYAKDFGQTFLMAVAVGIIGVCFNSIVAWSQHQWWPDDYPEEPETVALKSGEWYWVGVTTVAGFLVGLLSHFVLPKPHKGFFVQLSIGDVDYSQAPGVVLVSIVSLAGGCSLGPECALAFAGGGLAAWYAHLRGWKDSDRSSFVLSGMVAAIGAVFPSPVLSVMLMIEMNERKDCWDYRGLYMRSISLLTLAATTSFTIYYAMLEAGWLSINTFLKPINVDGASRIFLGISTNFIWTDCLTAAVIGVVAGFIGLLTFIIVGFINKNFNRLRNRISATGCHPVLSRIIPSTIAGVLIGLLAVAMPLTMGSGAEQLPALVRGSIIAQEIVQFNSNFTKPDLSDNFPDLDLDLGFLDRFNVTKLDIEKYQESFGARPLLLAALGKAVAFGLARGGGFVGGLIFPLIFIGASVGMAASALIPSLPWLLSFTCFFAAVPCSIMPAPISAMGIAAFTLAIGPYETAPIFTAAVVSHLTVLGSGVFQKIVPSRLPPANVIIEYEARMRDAKRARDSTFFSGKGQGPTDLNAMSAINGENSVVYSPPPPPQGPTDLNASANGGEYAAVATSSEDLPPASYEQDSSMGNSTMRSNRESLPWSSPLQQTAVDENFSFSSVNSDSRYRDARRMPSFASGI